jgi:hypothetical protein
MKLLHAHILSQEPEATVEVIKSWQKDPQTPHVEDQMHQRIKTYPPTGPHNHYYLFDNAQDTYWDGLLWSLFFKDVIQRGRGLHVVLFCHYGSPSARPVEHDNGTPLILHHHARISLIPDHDGTSDAAYPPIGLLFSREEFEEAVDRFEGPGGNHINLDEGLQQLLFKWTVGHAGAVGDLLHKLSKVSPTVT